MNFLIAAIFGGFLGAVLPGTIFDASWWLLSLVGNFLFHLYPFTLDK